MKKRDKTRSSYLKMMNEGDFKLKFQHETSKKLLWANTCEPPLPVIVVLPGSPTKGSPIIHSNVPETPEVLPTIPITPSFSSQSMPDGSPSILR
jgi:hypothetical protein